MTPETIIHEAQLAGVKLVLCPAGIIEVTGAGRAVKRWLTTIRLHKAEIIEVLKAMPQPTSCNDEGGKSAPLTQIQEASRASCKTCQHSTRAGNCAKPEGAGLLEPPGSYAIRFHPFNGRGCALFQPRLDPWLEQQIQHMASRWNYSPEELEHALELARADPQGWLRLVHKEGLG